MISRKKLRIFGVALSMVATASMVATPAYAATGQNGQRVAFRTTTATLEIVKREKPALYQRLLAYRSGQSVTVTPKERAYLQRVNRMASAAHARARATEFSSQSRTAVSSEARMAYAQAPAKVTVPARPSVVQDIGNILGVLGPLAVIFFPVVAPIVAFAVIIINLIIAAAEFLAKWWPQLVAGWGAVARR